MAVQTFDIRPASPQIGYGEDVEAKAERREGRWYKSDAVAFGGDTSNVLFRLPANSIVVGAFIAVETAFDASGTSAAATATVTVTNSTGSETIYDAANTGLQSSGLHPATAFCVISDTAAAPVVTLLLDPGTTTAGSVRVYIEVVQLEALL